MQDGQILLFDFHYPSTSGSWRVINDTVMGGVSTSQCGVSGSGSMVFSGIVSLDNSGGFASARAAVPDIDMSRSMGIAIRVRGDGKTYKLGLRTDLEFDGIYYQASFVAKQDEWVTLRIPFTSFAATYHGRPVPDAPSLEAGAIKTVGFLISDKQAGPFRLEVGGIWAYCGE